MAHVYRVPDRLVWLLDVTFDGQVYRLCDEQIDDVSTALGAVRYTPRLGALALSAAAAGTGAVGVAWDDQGAVLAAVRRGATVEGAPAVLRRHRVGDDIEQAWVWARGRLAGVAYGEAGEAATATLEVAVTDSGPILRPQAVIDDTTWPNAGQTAVDEAQGVGYPTVFGYPGHSTPWAAAPHAVVPCPMAERNAGTFELLVADGLIDAAAVEIRNETIGAGNTETIVTSLADLLSATVSTVEVTAADAAHNADSKDMFLAGFQNDGTYGGGTVSAYTGEVLSGAGDVVLWLMRRAPGRMRFDVAAQEAHRGELNRYQVDTWVNDPAMRAWDWVEQCLLPWASARVVAGPRGVYLRPWRWAATSTDAVAWLSADRGDATRETQVQFLHPAPANEITVQYARKGGRYLQRRTLSATYSRAGRYALAAVDSTIHAHPAAAASQAAYGVLPATVSLDHVWRPETPLRVAEEHLWARANPHQTVSYRGGAGLERLRVGDVVVIEDTAVGLHDRVALVDDVVVGGPAPLVRLLLPSTIIRTATT